jgi:radical SAM protein with 4Fe4S-binding SPASM domain
MCLHQKLTEVGDMEFVDFTKIIDILPERVSRVNPTGFGEPLLHEEICDMIEYSQKKKKYFECFTNATILDRDLSRNLLASGINSLHFSIDGAKKETYNMIRIGAKFDDVIENITNFMELRREIENPPHVALRVVLMKENIDEMCNFIELAHSLDIFDIRFQAMQYLFGVGLSKPKYAIHHPNETHVINQKFEEAQGVAQKLGVKIHLPRTFFINKIRCLQPWELIVVNWKGLVNPCLVAYDVSFGSIFDQPFKELWNNEHYLNWRKNMNSMSTQLPCISCTDR